MPQGSRLHRLARLGSDVCADLAGSDDCSVPAADLHQDLGGAGAAAGRVDFVSGGVPDNLVHALYRLAKLKSREDIVSGLETFPDTLLKLFRGENLGKLVLQVSG